MLVQQLKLLGLIALVLAEIGATVAHVNQVVRFRSGLDHNDTLRRMWSKADEIIFQPVVLPMPLALVLGLGVFGLMRSLVLSLLQIVGLAEPPTPATDFAVSILASLLGTLSAAATYVIDGGIRIWACTAGTLASLELWVLWHLLLAEPHHAPVSMLVVWIAATALVVLVGWYWVAKHLSTRSVASVSTNHFPWLVAVLGGILLVILRAADVLLFDYVGVDRSIDATYYLGGVLLQFAGIMVLMGCAFVAILVVNRGVMAGVYHWQWRALASPAPLVVCEAVIKALHAGHENVTPWFLAGDWAIRSVMYLASGFLGAAVYLGVLTVFAQKALTADIDNELILDDDDEDENDLDINGNGTEHRQFQV